MSTIPKIPYSGRVILSTQRGVALFIVLVFLLILTLLGLSAMQNTILGTKISQNLNARSLAYQAAELALRDAERDLDWKTLKEVSCPMQSNIKCRPDTQRPLSVTGAGDWSATCGGEGADHHQGQCFGIAPGAKVWETEPNWTNYAVTYGTYTGASAVPGVFQQPQYILELFTQGSFGDTGYEASSNYFRITARGYGVDSSSTPVTLQSIYILDDF